jgi:predicted O-linked N-acetylglucosamine transferase (SPINDLY family)
MKAAHKQKSDVVRKARQQWELGLACRKRRDYTEALKCFEQAVKLQPRDALYRMNAARTCLELNRDAEALNHAQVAIQIDPACDIAVTLRARALHRLNRHDEVLEVLDTLPPDRRDNREYWSARGVAMQGTGRHHEAIQDFLKALSHCMDDASTHYRMGVSFYELGLKEEAAECFRTGLILGLGASALHVHGMLAYAERENCRWAQADEQLEHMRRLVDETPATAAMMTAPFAHITLTDDPLYQLKACRLMANNFMRFSPVTRKPRSVDDGRIRIGYVSADFHQHATCVLMCEVFERTDRSQFEVYLYSHGPDDKTPMRKRVERAADHFVELQGVPDQQIAERIAEDDIDILVDLKGYTAQNRIGVFSRRPAPIQVSYVGFPGTTGASFIDYVIGDPIVTPIEHAAHFSEKIAQMPISYQPNDRHRPRPRPITRAEAGLPEGALVLCGFNQAYKISPEVLDVWASLLRDIPNSVLWLLDWHGQARPHLEDEMRARGIELQRVRWAPRRALENHMDRLALADIFIDTWPCNAHTTASDALWAGVPVVTYMGQSFAARVAASLLNAVGLNELITDNLGDYRRTVRELAADPQRRARLRQELELAREQAPLFDSPRYVRALDDLFMRIAQRHRAGLPPDHLPAIAD